jgi:putative protease
LTTTKLELLAPAGTTETLTAVLDAGADAVYLGGKLLNMRMHRASYNFDDRQLAAAIDLVHARQRKVYVTVNSLILESELPQVREALTLLGQLRPDGIIVQDLAVAAAAREACVHVPLHASTMMNVHSAETASALKLMGFVRIVTSRDVPLHAVRRMAEESGLEMEYFIHGDMCISESSQCYASGILFGEGGNRGRCMKTCRWSWELVPPDDVPGLDATRLRGHLLARKDLCMFQHIPQLVQNGIVSLKIEGRMRSPEFLAPLVSAYRQAIDAYFTNPAGYATDLATMDALQERRVREFSTCMSFHNPGATSVEPRGAREPRFFSTARRERELNCTPSDRVAPSLNGHAPRLAVRVGTPESAEAAVAAGANAIYIGGELFPRVGAAIDPNWIADFTRRTSQQNVKVTLLGSRIADERDLAEWRWLLARVANVRGVGVGVSSLGALHVAKDLRFRAVLADFSMNVTNSQAVDELSTQGVTRVTASLELETQDLFDFAANCRLPLEVVAHGPLPAMVLDHCLIAACTGHTPDDVCPMNCRRGAWRMRDTANQDHRLEVDRRCRNHLYMARDICLLPHLEQLAHAGIATLRIEAQFESPDAVATIVSAYRRRIDSRSVSTVADDVATIEAATHRPLGTGALVFDSPAPADVHSA